MKYKIATNDNSQLPGFRKQLEDEVNALIKKGWKPQGGICYALPYGTSILQAMVKEDNPKAEKHPEPEPHNGNGCHHGIHPHCPLYDKMQ